MKYFLTSNTNILDDYSSWDSLKKKYKVKIDDYNKILISLNNQRIVEDHDIFFNVIYLNDYIRINYK